MGTRSLPYDPERMRTRFRPYDPDQQLLLPQDLREWVPAGHLAHHVSDLVDAADLSPFYARYEGDGRRRSPYDPRMMVKVLVYGYATGVFSSRKLARRLEEDVALRMLAAGNFPAHRTLCEFRKKNLKAFGALFAEVVRLARELGLAGLGRVAVDGTKVRANASKRKAIRQHNFARVDESTRRRTSATGRTELPEDEAPVRTAPSTGAPLPSVRRRPTAADLSPGPRREGRGARTRDSQPEPRGGGRRPTRRSSRRGRAWRRSWRLRRAGRCTPSASGSRRRPWAGSRLSLLVWQSDSPGATDPGDRDVSGS